MWATLLQSVCLELIVIEPRPKVIGDGTVDNKDKTQLGVSSCSQPISPCTDVISNRAGRIITTPSSRFRIIAVLSARSCLDWDSVFCALNSMLPTKRSMRGVADVVCDAHSPIKQPVIFGQSRCSVN